MSKTTLSQGQQLLNIVAKSGIERDGLQALLESGRFTGLLQEFKGQIEPKPSTYMVTVDYKSSLADMIRAGKYDWAHKDITQEHFPFETRDAEEVELQLVHFGRTMTTRQVLDELNKQGLRPATLPELCAFGASQPKLQWQYPIVAFGSEWREQDGTPLVTYLCANDDKRELNLHTVACRWSRVRSHRFLVSRK